MVVKTSRLLRVVDVSIDGCEEGTPDGRLSAAFDSFGINTATQTLRSSDRRSRPAVKPYAPRAAFERLATTGEQLHGQIRLVGVAQSSSQIVGPLCRHFGASGAGDVRSRAIGDGDDEGGPA